jgi:hypothetical protein
MSPANAARTLSSDSQVSEHDEAALTLAESTSEYRELTKDELSAMIANGEWPESRS